MNLKKISPENKKKIVVILIILIAIVLFFAIKKGIQNRKIEKELTDRAYEELKSPGEIVPLTDEELVKRAYEELKAPEQNN